MIKVVEFKFRMDEKVKTPLDVIGIIAMMAVDNEGNQYFVKTKYSSEWFREDQLKAY